MDDAARELVELKTLITKTLEKRGVLARIRAELRANVFAAIEEQERAEGDAEGFCLIGACNERAKQLHSTQVGKLLTSLICEYLEWCSLDRTIKVFLPECNISRGLSRSELQEKLGFDRADAEGAPLLLKILEDHLKNERSGAFSGAKPNDHLEEFRSLNLGPRTDRR